MAKKLGVTESDALAVLQQRNAIASDPENEAPSAPIVNGWTLVDLEDLPTKGKFYGEVWVKPFDVQTVREASSIDPNNAPATLKGMCNILSKCCYIIDLKGNKVLGSKLKRADALPVLMIIRALTYADDFTLPLAQSVKCSVCGKEIESIQCDGAAVLEWPSKLDEIATINEDGEILYDKFTFHLPTIEEVSTFISVLLSDDPAYKLDETTRNDASSLLYICKESQKVPQMHKALIQASSSMYSMDLKDIAKFRKFVQFLDRSIGTEPTIDTECPHCHEMIKIPFSVGIADICLATVEDF